MEIERGGAVRLHPFLHLLIAHSLKKSSLKANYISGFVLGVGETSVSFVSEATWGYILESSFFFLWLSIKQLCYVYLSSEEINPPSNFNFCSNNSAKCVCVFSSLTSTSNGKGRFGKGSSRFRKKDVRSKYELIYEICM